VQKVADFFRARLFTRDSTPDDYPEFACLPASVVGARHAVPGTQFFSFESVLSLWDVEKGLVA
jgi:hypothetical protein